MLPVVLALANANKDAIITAPKKFGRLARTGGDTSHADEVSQYDNQTQFPVLSNHNCKRTGTGVFHFGIGILNKNNF